MTENTPPNPEDDNFGARFVEIDTTRPSMRLPDSSVDEKAPEIRPPVDIGEDEFEYLFVVEIPGVPIDELEVRAQRHLLEIAASTSLRASEESKRFLQVERELGDCHRAFSLPHDADVDRLRYDLLDGVLHIHVPKVSPEELEPGLPRSLVATEEMAIPRPERPESALAVAQPNLIRLITSHQDGTSRSAGLRIGTERDC